MKQTYNDSVLILYSTMVKKFSLTYRF